MLRLPLQSPCAQHAACLQQFMHIVRAFHSKQAANEMSAVIPEQWQADFVPTPPVPVGVSTSTTAFKWAKKQMPDLPLSLLGKFFRLRQVRIVQDGQVKRVTQTRSLLPGDVLLLPKDLPTRGPAGGSSGTAATAAAAVHMEVTQAGETVVHMQDYKHQEQQQQQQQHHQQELMAIQQQELIDDEGLELSNSWLQQQHIMPPNIQQQQQRQRHQQLQALSAPLSLRPYKPEQQYQQLTTQQVRRWLLASSQDVALLYKPPGVSFQGSRNDKHSTGTQPSHLDPVFAEALRIEPPEVPQVVGKLDIRESGAVVIARHAAAHQWLSAWIAGDPAAVAAAAAALGGNQESSSSSSRGGGVNSRAASKRARQQQQKLKRLVAAAAAVENTGSSSHGVATYTAKEVAGLQQLLLSVGGLRLRRVFWAVVQGRLPVRQTGTMRNRMLRQGLSLPSLTRYRVLASREGLSWLELQPLTDRQNQIRVHCSKSLGTPVLGDYKYGYRPWAASPSAEPRLAQYQSRVGSIPDWQQVHLSSGQQNDLGDGTAKAPVEALMLHCREVVLLRPRKPPVRVVAPLPRAMKQLLQVMDWV